MCPDLIFPFVLNRGCPRNGRWSTSEACSGKLAPLGTKREMRNGMEILCSPLLRNSPASKGWKTHWWLIPCVWAEGVLEDIGSCQTKTVLLSEDDAADDNPESQEMLEEQLVRLLTREVMDLASKWIQAMFPEIFEKFSLERTTGIPKVQYNLIITVSSI